MDASALDRVLDCHNAYGAQIAFPATETLDAAREELAALRARVEDLELIARAMDLGAMWRYAPGRWMADGVRVEDDGSGLPLLTAEARRALRGET